MLLNTLLSIFVGALLGVGLALLLELLNRRVRSPEDIVEALGLPVIGYLDAADARKSRGRRRQKRLVFPRFNPDRALPAPR